MLRLNVCFPFTPRHRPRALQAFALRRDFNAEPGGDPRCLNLNLTRRPVNWGKIPRQLLASLCRKARRGQMFGHVNSQMIEIQMIEMMTAAI